MAYFEVKFAESATNDERHNGMMRVAAEYYQADGAYYFEKAWNTALKGSLANLQGMIEQRAGQQKITSIKEVQAIPPDAV